jgi:hypothetical protein
MPTTARLVDERTGEVIWLERDESDPDYCQGPVITNSIDYGYPSPRVVNNNIPDANGTVDLTEFHAARVVSWNGWITPTPSDPFPALTWDKLRKLTAPNRRPWLFVSENGWTTERRMVLRGDSVGSPLDRALGPVIVGAVSWVCPAGVLESSANNQQQILLSGGTGGLCVDHNGFCFNDTCGSTFAPGSFGGSTNIVNAGSVVTYPVITFTGPCKNPRVINTTTQTGIYLNCTLVPNQSIVVDCLHDTVTEVAIPPINRLAYYDYTKSSWIRLDPGDNYFSYSSDDKQGSCTFNWRDRWI